MIKNPMDVVKIPSGCRPVQTDFYMSVIVVNLNVFFNPRVGLFPNFCIVDLSTARETGRFSTAPNEGNSKYEEQPIVIIFFWSDEILLQ